MLLASFTHVIAFSTAFCTLATEWLSFLSFFCVFLCCLLSLYAAFPRIRPAPLASFVYVHSFSQLPAVQRDRSDRLFSLPLFPYLWILSIPSLIMSAIWCFGLARPISSSLDIFLSLSLSSSSHCLTSHSPHLACAISHVFVCLSLPSGCRLHLLSLLVISLQLSDDHFVAARIRALGSLRLPVTLLTPFLSPGFSQPLLLSLLLCLFLRSCCPCLLFLLIIISQLSDDHFVAALIRALGSLRLSPMSDIRPVWKQLTRYLERDRLVRSFQSVVTQACLEV